MGAPALLAAWLLDWVPCWLPAAGALPLHPAPCSLPQPGSCPCSPGDGNAVLQARQPPALPSDKHSRETRVAGFTHPMTVTLS